MRNVIFYTGSSSEPKVAKAIERFEEMDRIEYLSSEELRPEAYEIFIYLTVCLFPYILILLK